MGFLDNLTQDQRQGLLHTLLAAGGQMMAASGPSLQPVGTGQAIGSGLLAGMQSLGDYQNAALTRKWTQARLAEADQKKKSRAAFAGILADRASRDVLPANANPLMASGLREGILAGTPGMIGQRPGGPDYELMSAAAQVDPALAMSAYKAMAPKAPTMRDFNEGKDVVTKQWTNDGWQEVSRSPRWKTETEEDTADIRNANFLAEQLDIPIEEAIAMTRQSKTMSPQEFEAKVYLRMLDPARPRPELAARIARDARSKFFPGNAGAQENFTLAAGPAAVPSPVSDRPQVTLPFENSAQAATLQPNPLSQASRRLKTNPNDPEVKTILSEAREAISAGAVEAEVRRRLEKLGVDPNLL